MKPITLYLFSIVTLLSSVNGFSQGDGLYFENSSIMYQRVFEGELTNPVLFLESIQGTKEVRSTNDVFFCEIQVSEVEIESSMKEIELSKGSTAVFLQDAEYKMKVKLELKEGRYRVTVSEFECDLKKAQLKDGAIEQYIVKNNGDIRPKQFQQAQKIFNHIFQERFEHKVNSSPGGDDW